MENVDKKRWSSMMLRTCFVIVAGMGWFGATAGAQATRPSSAESPGKAAVAVDQAWPKAVGAFAKALAAGELNASVASLTPHATIRRFDSNAREELWRLAGRAENSAVIGQHAYVHPPLVMAADIAADFKNAAGISDVAKAPFLVDDETAIRQANATAVQWVVEQLEVADGTPVGVIVLWAPRASAVGAAETPGCEPVFILCRGEAVGKGFKINAVVYGDPAAGQK